MIRGTAIYGGSEEKKGVHAMVEFDWFSGSVLSVRLKARDVGDGTKTARSLNEFVRLRLADDRVSSPRELYASYEKHEQCRPKGENVKS